jgi:hypothetical protein
MANYSSSFHSPCFWSSTKLEALPQEQLQQLPPIQQQQQQQQDQESAIKIYLQGRQ